MRSRSTHAQDVSGERVTTVIVRDRSAYLCAFCSPILSLGSVTGPCHPSGSLQSVELDGRIVVRGGVQRWPQNPSHNRTCHRAALGCVLAKSVHAPCKVSSAKADGSWRIVQRGLTQAGNRAGKIARHNSVERTAHPLVGPKTPNWQTRLPLAAFTNSL